MRGRVDRTAALPERMMHDGWYYNSLGETMGPVSFETIVELARDGLLSPADQVRSATHSAWVAADSIVGLTFGTGPADQDLEVATDLSDLDITFGDSESNGRSAADSSSRTLLEETTRPTAGTRTDAEFALHDTRPSSPTLRSAAPPATVAQPVTKPTVTKPAAPTPASGPDGGSANADGGEASPLSQLLGRIKKPVLGVGAVLTLLALVWYAWPVTARDRAMIETMHTAYKEFCELRQRKASDADWTVFESKLKTDLDPLRNRLETMSIEPRTVPALMRDGLKDFDNVVQSGRGDPNDSERAFVARLNRARLLIDPHAERVVVPGIALNKKPSTRAAPRGAAPPPPTVSPGPPSTGTGR